MFLREYMIATSNGNKTILNYNYVFLTRMWYCSEFMSFRHSLLFVPLFLCVLFLFCSIEFIISLFFFLCRDLLYLQSF